MRRLVTFAALIALGSGSALGGELHILRPTYPLAPAKAGDVQPMTPDLDLVDEGNANWRFSFKDPAAFRTTLKLAAANARDGYEPVTLYFDVPYYWTNQELVSPFADDDDHVPGALAFARSVHALPSDHASLALLNQRARRIFQGRDGNQGVGPQPADVVVVYYLLQSSWALAQRDNMKIDTVTARAIDWVGEQAGKPKSVTSRLFGTQTVPLATLQALIASINGRDPMVMNFLVKQLDDDLKSPLEGKRSAACVKARSLSLYFASLDLVDRAALDGNLGNSVRAAELANLCTNLQLKAAPTQIARVTPTDAAAVLKASQILTDDAKNQHLFPAARQNAINRAAELKALVQP